LVSPLIASTFENRAGSPEEKVSSAFNVIIETPDTLYEYARIYSIFRSSLNGEPTCKRVVDLKIPKYKVEGG
jgi:hypothetical protein